MSFTYRIQVLRFDGETNAAPVLSTFQPKGDPSPREEHGGESCGWGTHPNRHRAASLLQLPLREAQGQCCCICCALNYLRIQCLYQQREHCPPQQGAVITEHLAFPAAGIKGLLRDTAVLLLGQGEPGGHSHQAFSLYLQDGGVSSSLTTCYPATFCFNVFIFKIYSQK